MANQNIVIIGGGIAGMEIVTGLSKRYAQTDTSIILIDKNPYHVWKPMLHKFAAGTAIPAEEGISYIQQAKLHGFYYIPGMVTDIDKAHKQVQISELINGSGIEVLPVRTINYDQLIVCTGSRANDFGTPGVKEFAYTIDDLKHASRFFDDFRANILRALNSNTSCHITIVGAGASGVELAGEIYRYLDLASNYWLKNQDIVQTALALTIVESNPRILKTFNTSISNQAKTVLEKLGTRVVEGTKVIEVHENHVKLSNGEDIHSELTVWTTGIQAPALLSSIKGLTHSGAGQIAVNQYLQSIDDASIFALGDSSAILDTEGKRGIYPTTAQVAQQQARYLQRYLPQMLSDKSIPAFTYKDKGSIVTVSRYDSFGVFGAKGIFRGNTFRGYKAMLAHIMLYRAHQKMILGFWKTIIAWLADKLNAIVKPSVRTY